MINTYLDLTIARFPNLSSVIHSEVLQSDIVVIDTYVPGGIYHSDQLNWKGDLTFYSSEKEFIRSKREIDASEESRQYFARNGYTFRTEVVDEKKCTEFLEVYKNTTLRKDRAIDYNAGIIIKKNLRTNIPVRLFGLYDSSGMLQSGLLCSEYKDEFRVMFGAKKRFDAVRGGVGGVLEIELLRHCFHNNILKISHGLSKNPAGIVDTAGVFEFKTRYGFTAFPVGEWKTTFVLNPEKMLSELVFLTAQDGQLSYMVLGRGEQKAAKYQGELVTLVSFKSIDKHVQQAKTILDVA